MGGFPSIPKVSLPSDAVVVVTGANSGIGYAMAKQFALLGVHVILACRSEQRAKEAMARIRTEVATGKRKQSNSDNTNLQLEFMFLDLDSISTTMEFINAFKQTGRKLHVLMCNAGIFANPWAQTTDGYERQFQVNYLGHFLIVAHLLPIMKHSGDDCRIVLTSSSQANHTEFDLDTIQARTEGDYGRLEYYGKSKLYMSMQTVTMAPQLAGTNVSLNCFNPGPTDTNLFRNIEDTSCIHCVNLGRCCLNRPADSAKTGVYLAVSPKLKGLSGGYYVKGRLKCTSDTVRNKTYQEQLWNYTVNILRPHLPADFPVAL